MNRRHTYNAGALIALLLFFALHLPLLDSIPPFIDESVHIEMARQMTATSPLYGAQEGRLLSVWYWALFTPQVNASFWVLRAATVLVMTLAAASVIGIGRLAGDVWGAAFVLFLFSPMNTFYNTVGLSDPVGASLLLTALYFTSRLRVRVSLWDAALAGGCLFAAAGAKIAYLPYAVVPVLGVMTLPRATWQARIRWAGVSLVVFGVLFGVMLGVLTWRGYDLLFHILRSTGTGDGETSALMGLLERMAGRTRGIVGTYVHYVGAIMGGIGGMALLAHVWRRDVFLLLVLFVPGLTVWMSSLYFTRYLYFHMALMAIITGVVLGWWARDRLRRMIGVAVVGIYGVLVWLPFYATMLTNPAALPLTAGEYIEYFAADSAGAGLAEIEAFLVAQDAERVIGLLPNCLSLKYSTLDTLTVDCPRVNPNGEDIPVLYDLVVRSRAPGVMVVKENSPYVPQDIPGEIVYEVARPGDLTVLTVYDLSPD